MEMVPFSCIMEGDFLFLEEFDAKVSIAVPNLNFCQNDSSRPRKDSVSVVFRLYRVVKIIFKKEHYFWAAVIIRLYEIMTALFFQP